jgi:hypothetical protein
VFNLFESLLKIIKREGVNVGIDYNTREEIIHDIFFSDLDFFNYYDDGEINVADIIKIFGSDTNPNTDGKGFDFIGFLNKIYTCFQSDCNPKNTVAGIKRRRESNTLEDFNIVFIENLFDELNNFLDTPKNKDGTQLDVINYFIYETIRTNGSDTTMDETGGGGSKNSIYKMKGGENQNIGKIDSFLNNYTSKLVEFANMVEGKLNETIKTICNESTLKREEFISKTLEILNNSLIGFLQDEFFKKLETISDFLEKGKIEEKFKTNLNKVNTNLTTMIDKRKYLFNVNTRQILDTFCDDNKTIQKIMEKYKKDLNGELAPFLKIIEDQKKIYELEDKKANLAELKREAANESGGLGDKKIVQENFLTAVAKLGLFLNEIDDYSYEDLDVNLEPVMYLCNLEKEILKYYARGCEGRPSYRDLDTKLYDA